jgi:hypothetical protein
MLIRKVWRYQRDNKNTLIEEGQPKQRPKDKRTKGQAIFYKTL